MIIQQPKRQRPTVQGVGVDFHLKAAQEAVLAAQQQGQGLNFALIVVGLLLARNFVLGVVLRSANFIVYCFLKYNRLIPQ